jgi:general secretion pathway protein L
MTDHRLVFLSRDGSLSPEVRITTPAARPRQQRILVVPGEEVLGRWIAASGRTPAQARAAALAQLAPDLAAPPSELAAALGPERGGDRLVCIVARSRVDGWRAQATARGFTPDLIVPDYAVLASATEPGLRLSRRDGSMLVAGDGLAFAAEPELARLLIQSRTTAEIDFDAAILSWARGGGPALAPDLLSAIPSRAEPGSAQRSLARTGLYGLLALLLAVLAPWIQVWRLDGAARDMRAEAAATLRSLLPDAPAGASPRALLRAELAAYRADPALMSLTAQVLEALAATPAVDIRKVEAIAPGEVHARLGVATPDDLAPLRQSLAERGLALEETSTPDDAARLAVDLVVRGSP